MYLPEMNYPYDDHYSLPEIEIMSYLYENTIPYEKIDLIYYEDEE
jgi:hypothetical protein